ncbi:hypothetical protein HZI73_10755 [Vallitalea pronyensis]|uniref:Apea-like HEPN domain-containing protein n=1 Tax=Vallitalea pronyensis TaxID=1348613 RepID=A0A8J8MJB8_9FIRM|nr:hypothetical protein [Vallitalea pronyensis]QUI22740.1 hypothetical protein HZI73_10755 [Vallitalea pronyensis]
MEFEINYNTVEESNMFLRSLWSKLRDNKKMGWQFFPYRDSKNKIVELGFVASPVLSCLYKVKVKYKIRGCIMKLIFESVGSGGDKSSDFDTLIKLISEAIDFSKEIKLSYRYMTYNSIGAGIDNYIGRNFEIVNHGKKFSTIFAIEGFDDKDVGSVLAKINTKVIDFLSTQTSHVIYTTTTVKKLPNSDRHNDFVSKNWVDTYPIIDNRMRIMESSIAVIDKIIRQDYNEDLEKYLDACRLFHTATKYTSFIYNIDHYDFKPVEYDLSFDEVANMLYMSSFEVLSTIMDSSVTKCKKCNQNIYSIRQKVIKLIENYSGGYMDKNSIDEYYKKRSAYVHSGNFFSNRSYYGGVSNPQLDKSDIGVVMQLPLVNLHALREVGGFIFREFLIKYFGF